MKLTKNPDTGKTVAWIALAGAVGYGIYTWIKGKEAPKTSITVSNVTIERRA